MKTLRLFFILLPLLAALPLGGVNLPKTAGLSFGSTLWIGSGEGGGLSAFEARAYFTEFESALFGILAGIGPADAGRTGVEATDDFHVMGVVRATNPDGWLYLLLGAGIHIYNGGRNVIGLGLMAGLGLDMPLTDRISLDLGLRFHYAPATVLTFLAGANYRL